MTGARLPAARTGPFSRHRSAVFVQSPSMGTNTRRCIALALAAGVFLLAGCDRGTKSGGAKPHVAYVTNGIDSFWTIAEAGAKAGAQKYDVEVEVHMPAQGVADQKRIVEDL